MRFMIMVEHKEGAMGPPPPELMQAIATLGMEATQAGVMVETGGLMPTASGARVHVSREGKLTVTDGPFTEAKEVVGGYAVYEVETREDALYWTNRFMQLHADHWPGWEGTSEIRQVILAPKFDCPRLPG